MLIELLKLQLALGNLVKGDTQQAVFMELTDVVKSYWKYQCYVSPEQNTKGLHYIWDLNGP